MRIHDPRNPVGKKNWMIITLLTLVIFILSIAVIMGMKFDDEMEDNSGPSIPDEGATSSIVNFTLDEQSMTSRNIHGQYKIYSVTYPDFTNKTANETLEKYFGAVSEDPCLSFSNMNDEVFAHIGTNYSYILNSDGRLVYTRNLEPPGYTVDSIANNTGLNNISQSRALVEIYIKKVIGSEFQDFTFEKAKTSKSVIRQRESIFEYVFYYERKIDNVSCYRNSGGQIVVAISPDGTIDSFQYLRLELKDTGISSIGNLTDVLKGVDTNFDLHKKDLFAGYTDYTLFYSESTYGLIDGRMMIGWQLYFYCGDDTSVISSTFAI